MKMENTFKSMQLYPWIINNLNEIGIKKPTIIQGKCIPEILKGNDCIGAAKTGSGKTLAFVLPILQRLSDDPYGVFALILTPTRELAYQISDQFLIIGKGINLKVCTITGGMDIINQGQQLIRKPHIVVATPGRLTEYLNGDTVQLDLIRFLVLDEADRLLGTEGFDKQLKKIFAQLPAVRQNLFFSATITDVLQKISQISSKETFTYQVPYEESTNNVLSQYYVLCPFDVKDVYLVQVLINEATANSTIVFTNSCRNCQILWMVLNKIGITSVVLHSRMKQYKRNMALSKFKSKNVKILIATDVAARGLDIPSVELVINYTLPQTDKEYIHRVGRTARAGRQGKSITLITPYDVKHLQRIEQFIQKQLNAYDISDKEVSKIFKQVSLLKSESILQLDKNKF